MKTFNPNFLLLRLRHSSLPELFHRIRQIVTRQHLKLSTKPGGGFSKIPVIEIDEIENLLMPDLIPDPESNSRHALNSFNLKHLLNGRPSDPEGSETDIRIKWEPARLQQAAALLVYDHQYRKSAEPEKARQAAKRLIFSWINANPFPRGLHYQSAMECAMRIPVFFTALKKIDDLTSDESAILLKTIYHNGWLISKQLSLYSSLGNHTITEAVGLIFAGAVYRSTRRGKDWLTTGIKLLNDELPHQILDDGGPAEQSLNYHRFVLDLYWLAMDFIQKNSLGDVDHWQKKLSTGEFFLDAFKDQSVHSPAIGDSDDGFAVAPGISPRRLFRADRMQNHITFPDSGYTIIRNNHLVFTFDHGPLGLPPLYNHGHADALSITLSKNGHPLLIDPGTYRYNGVAQWRRYFKGTRAHNTVTIDNQDQAVQETGFIWSKPYRSELTAAKTEKNLFFCTAFHDGYTRLKHPVRHYRSVACIDQTNFLIRDSFSGTGTHKFQINYHLHPDVQAKQKGKWWILENHGEYIFLRLSDGYLMPVKGGHDPIMGWFSSRYGKKEATTVLTFTKRGTAKNVTFVTIIFTQ